MGNKALFVHVDIKSMSAVQLNKWSQYETEAMIDAKIPNIDLQQHFGSCPHCQYLQQG
jgi:hypothetical protein